MGLVNRGPHKTWERTRSYGWKNDVGWGYHRMYLVFQDDVEIGYYDYKKDAKRWCKI